MTCARRLAGARKPVPCAGSPSRPEPRPGRRRARLFRLLPVLALLLGALSPFVAAPATADVLVSNVGQATGETTSVASFAQAQGFTTGDVSSGYALESIEVKVDLVGSLTTEEQATIRVELWSDSSGAPGSKIASLTVPTSLTSGTANVAFNAPAGTTLSASTTYHVVVYTTGGTLTKFLVRRHVTNDEDSGAASKWSIADGSTYALSDGPTSSTSWTSFGHSLLIRVNGLRSGGEIRRGTKEDLPPGFCEKLNRIDFRAGFLNPAYIMDEGPLHFFPGENDCAPPPEGIAGTVPTASPSARYASLIAKMRESRNDPRYEHNKAHTDRWDRALKAFGETVPDASLPAMTADEAQGYADRGWTRWTEVAQALGEIENPVAVSLSAAPNPVDEGSAVTVTATLASELSRDVTIPLVVTRGTSEAGDHGTLAGIAVPAGFLSASGTIATADDADRDDETFTVALGTLPLGVAAGSASSVQVTIDDDTPQPQVVGGGGGEDSNPYAALIAKMYAWRNDPRYVSDKAHTERWDRALKAFGETVSDGSLSAMTADEAQGYADRGWTPWVEVAKALGEIESAGTQPPPPAPDPVVTIAAGGAVTEGAAAGFTLKASRAPASDLGVSVTVSESGAFAQSSALGARTVTIEAGQTSAAFTVATVDDTADEADGAIAAALGSGSGYTVGATARATVAVADNDEAPPAAVTLPAIATKRAMAREGSGAAVVFTVRLDRAASQTVSVDYATADGTGRWAGTAPARAGADYTAVSGTLSFAAGETLKSVSVPILDDSIDEGTEYFLVRFSNPEGATLASRYRETQGLIRNSDPLQAQWLSRFGRMAASDAVAALTARLETPRAAGSHLTVLGQRVALDGSGESRALTEVLTGFAQAFGAPTAPAAEDDPGSGSGAGDPFRRHGLSNSWSAHAPTVAGGRRVTERELLMGTSFRAVLPAGAGSQFTSWGQGASVSQFSAALPGLGLSGEAATGSLGFDYEHGRLLTGFALTHSVGEGMARDAGWRYGLGSTATTMLPFARLALTDRLSAWAMAGTGTGQLTLDLDGPVSQRYRTDLAMTLAATGVRGELVTPAEAGGFALALKADAFWVRTESDAVTASEFGSLMGARGESSRVRAVLDGSRTFALSGGATLAPSVELGLRHDGGDAETGTGLEFGAGLGYADPSRGLDMALKVHGLAAHAEQGYEEWGVSGQLRLVPGGAGRGLSASFTPSYGVDPGGTERLWALPDASGLAANENAAPSHRLDAEMGYGLPLFGDRFTGTPNVGLGLSDTARELRMGWRLTPAGVAASRFEVNLDAVRREAANANEPVEHGVMLRSQFRW